MPRRRIVLLAVLLAMFWQGVVTARIGWSMTTLAGLEHAALHWQAEDHHHHDDGSFHREDSSESARHGMTDHVGGAVALLTTDAPAALTRPHAAPAVAHAGVVKGPLLDGLLRPPRTLL